MMVDQWLPKLPEALLTLFSVLVLGWLAFQRLSLILVVPLGVAVLAGAHLFASRGRTTQIGLGIAYVGGGVIAGFLLVGFMIPGGTPEEYEAYARVATPLLVLYATSVLTLPVKLR